MSTYSSLTAQNVSGSIIRPVAGTEVTISSLYTSSEPAPISYTYKWYKSTRLTAPLECEYGVIPADFTLFNADDEAIETSSINATMAGTYRCDVEAKNPDNMIVGQEVTFFSVLPPAVVLNEANTIGYESLLVPPAPLDPVESGDPNEPSDPSDPNEPSDPSDPSDPIDPVEPGLPANTVQPQVVPAGEVTEGIVMYLDASNPQSYSGEGATWVDLSGNNHHAIVHGPNVWTSEDGGQFDYGDVDQTESYITLPHTAAQSVGNEWTLEFVMKPRVTDTAKYFGSVGTATDENHILLRVRDSGISAYRSYDNFEIADDETIHFAITGSDNETGHYYKNGISQGSSSHIKQINEVAAGGWILNHDQDSLGGGFQGHQNYRGAFMTVKLYNRKLSPVEISQNASALLLKYYPNANAPIAPSGGYYSGTLNVHHIQPPFATWTEDVSDANLTLYTMPGDTQPTFSLDQTELFFTRQEITIPYQEVGNGNDFTHPTSGFDMQPGALFENTSYPVLLRANVDSGDGTTEKIEFGSILLEWPGFIGSPLPDPVHNFFSVS